MENQNRKDDEVKLTNDDMENTDRIPEEVDNVTREINLDDLYDGAVNNTVVIDPVTNDEILMSNKKPNYTIIGVLIAVIVLLILYYVNNKSDFGRTTKDVAPKTTTIRPFTTKKNEVGTLTCTYSSKSDAENQSVTYTANYENEKILKSTFNYVAMSNSDTSSAIIEDLKKQYETFFINNASILLNNVSYEKTETGFNFSAVIDYEKKAYENLVLIDNQTILFEKPNANDTVSLIQDVYTKKGFVCSLTSNNEANYEE